MCLGTENAARHLDEADAGTPDFAEFQRLQQERRGRVSSATITLCGRHDRA